MTTFTVTLHDDIAAHVERVARECGISTDDVLGDAVSSYLGTEPMGDQVNGVDRVRNAADVDGLDHLWFIPEPDGRVATSDIAANFDEELAKAFPAAQRNDVTSSLASRGTIGTDASDASETSDLSQA